ncbi:MAG: cyclic GMP-AMP synthase DncV-like nucleotidyltransferase [Alphaproteobacteria bacterium]
MFNLHDDLNAFFIEHIRLGKDRRHELAEFRDNSLSRLRSGLDKLGERRGEKYSYPAETRNQGGYAMHTLNKAADNNYDLDSALIFERSALPSSARAARERIRDAFVETGNQFKTPPEARENAVTIWYESGQHLDFAIYRRYTDALGREIIEHASGDEWRPRDPDAVTTWFKNLETKVSPAGSAATVEEKQFRKIVRFLKFFTKSRLDWRLPGGMIMSALAELVYEPHSTRDDASLLLTLEKLHNRLQFTTIVPGPLGGTDLTAKPSHKQEVEALRDELARIVPKMGQALRAANCTKDQARNAWRMLFNHEFWNAANAVKQEASMLKVASVAPVAGSFSFPDTARAPNKPLPFG